MGNSPPIVVERSQEEHIPALVEIGRNIYKVAGFETLGDYDTEHITKLFTDSLNGNQVASWVILSEEKLVGFGLAAILPFWFRPMSFLCHELGMWIEPEYRKLGAGKKLIEAIADWGKEKKVDAVCQVTFSGMTPRRVAKQLQGAGYRRFETLWARRF